MGLALEGRVDINNVVSIEHEDALMSNDEVWTREFPC